MQLSINFSVNYMIYVVLYFRCERCRPQCGHACELLCHQNCVSAEKCSSCDAIKEETSKKARTIKTCRV